MGTLVIGAGVDELAAAHTLSRSGRQVLVLDQRGAVDEPPMQSGWVPARVIGALDLARHGLRVVRPDPWITAPLPQGGVLELWNDTARSAQSIAKLSARDAANWPDFCARMAKLAGLLEDLYSSLPPDPMSSAARDLMQLGALGWRAKRLGRLGLEDLMRVLPMPAADLLDDWFESDVLKAVLGAAAVMHLQQGPRSGGTALSLLHHHVGSAPGVFRAPLSNVAQVLGAMPGIDIRRGASVERISVRARQVEGVLLESGEELSASLILSGADPQRVLIDWVDASWLDPSLVRAVRNIRRRGVVARMTLGLDREPGFNTLALAQSLDHLEHAYDDSKYGRMSAAPYIEARSLGVTPNGRHRVDVHIQYAPYRLTSGTWDANSTAALADHVLKSLGEARPALIDAIVERTMLSPVDLERDEAWPQGQAYGAELALDQWLWMRPVPALARYATPIGGLYLCGQAMHPGAGVLCASGHHATVTALHELNGNKKSR